jgi:hypothetical protein
LVPAAVKAHTRHEQQRLRYASTGMNRCRICNPQTWRGRGRKTTDRRITFIIIAWTPTNPSKCPHVQPQSFRHVLPHQFSEIALPPDKRGNWTSVSLISSIPIELGILSSKRSKGYLRKSLKTNYARKWCAQGDDLRTLLGDVVTICRRLGSG